MQSIVSKGKDVSEAVKLGLELLDVTKKEVNIEIIQNQTKGFMGIGSKEAVVKLTKLDHHSFSGNERSEPIKEIDFEEYVSTLTEEDLERVPIESRGNTDQEMDLEEITPDMLEGKVWVKDGQLCCKSSPDQFPMVSIKGGVKLYKNDQRVNEKTIIVSEKDFYQLMVEDEEKPTKWNITMDEEKLKVFLHVEPGYKISRNVPDITADQHIEIGVEEKKEILTTINYSEIMQRLESLRVKHGFHQDEIVRAMDANEPGIFEIASGRSPVSGKDGWIEIKVNLDSTKGPKEKEGGLVDFRDLQTIPTVDRGKVIAIIHPPVPGQIGCTVTNEPLPAKQTLPIVLKAGQGVSIVDDKVVSTEPGRPRIEQRGQLVKVAIMPKLTHMGNVDLSSGNIRFMGDVEICGNVEERMVVEAEGDIMIHKSVNFASITASGAITTFGNVIGSEVSAGKNNLLVTELGHLLGNINQNIEKIMSLIKQLTTSPAFKSSDFSRGGLQPLIRILMEKKFKNFPSLVKKYVEIVRKGEGYLQDEEWREVAVSLSQVFLSITNEVTSLERIEYLSKKIKTLHEISSEQVEPNSYITIPNAQNSILYSSGNILIIGQGCINTKIHAGGMVKIDGILRGGEVYGRLGVEMNEVGSESGTPTLISVPNDQMIFINKAMEGTSIKIGTVKYTFKETKYWVKARLNDIGRIVIE
ncbi:flagellar assembly protein A [Metabacillus halosaccharovorans]|uniref:flagellar assembly protein A n=1 Tax=Metabacillus halosaccharovorans TaxID=930124 RepID=UPI00203BF567|nr:FapA family protein [Metabacillus halosaccharovorans]MCM3443393.1 FapA family protein [Metabacillus halosaccharovorans]